MSAQEGGKAVSEVSFESHLDEILQNLDQDKIPRILETIGLVAEGYAKRLCPVDTGNLRNSITHASDMSDQSAIIGTNVEYGKYVELGHRQDPGRYVPALGKALVADHVAPQPFLRPAVEDHKSEYKSLVEAVLKS